ncbi:putative serine esterase-domain-containing protein [Glomus cerebriforme]|uniref:Putative serine esterase-domain-containing protein n=1 Tax=Glomus cerebriforme TaxID=658196 RepID=A0A397SCL3_9GLOM|nr:putative serine esterase-domain-containing protein [Glomus cerebriforme]
MINDGEIRQVHLVVFVHGLWGNPNHLKYLVNLFTHFHGDKLHLLNAKCNVSDYTYDGVDVCGKRLVGEIKEELKSIKEMNIKITKFSIIGYSLGGLVSRYAIGLLYSQGFFKYIEPIVCIRREDNTKWIKFVNWTSSNLLSKTGEQLQYIDKFEGDEPLLYVISKPDTVYYKALESFKYRKIYANARRDNSVPFWTAAITDVNPFDKYNELNIVTNEKCVDIIESISLLANPEENYLIHKSTMKLVPYYALIFISLPVLVPIGSTILLSTLPTHLFKSKRRIQQEKMREEGEEHKEREIYRDELIEEINTIVTNVEENVFETAMNLKNFVDSSALDISTREENSSLSSEEQCPPDHKHGTQIRLSNFTTSPLFPKLAISKAQHDSFLNLNKLQLDKVVVCMDHALNSHASIIVRGSFYNEGKELLKLYVEEIFQP